MKDNNPPNLPFSIFKETAELASGVGPALLNVISIMSRLRAPDGCPWDRAQTHESLLGNLMEEAHEYMHAVRAGDTNGMREELGDLLLQVIFHAQIAAEAGTFDLKTVADELADKLLRRHPHVFGDVKANSPDEALQSWNHAKQGEGSSEVSPTLGSTHPELPALIRARKVVDAAGRVGFEWRKVGDALDKLQEEIGELRREIESGDRGRIEDELGDVLFMTACVARYVKLCPEVALTGSIAKFVNRFRHIETRLAEKGLTPEQSTLEEMDRYWDEAKEIEKE